MKLAVVVLAFFSLVVAQSGTGELPPCAKDCVTKFTSGSEIGGCQSLDAKCICASSSFISGIACCLASACNKADQDQAVQFAISFCATQGVSVPSAVSCTASMSSIMAATGTAAGNASSITSTTLLTGTTSPSATSATQNVGTQGQAAGPGVAGIFGGLVAALAFL